MSTSISGSKLAISIAAMGAALMAVLDISIVNVALSEIRANFGTPLDQIAWVSTGYMMANIVVIPMTGWLQRKFGYRRYFVGSVLLFTVASALCGLSWNLASLVTFRALQGLGGGAILPTSQVILFARYPKEQHGLANALFGLGAITGPLLGPALGGVMISALNWHWIFLINVPFGLFVAYLAWRNIEQPNQRDPKEPVDAAGIALLAVGMATLQYVLEEGHRDGWFQSRKIVFLAIVSAIALVTFVVHELETPSPVVDFRVFASRSYTAATAINGLSGMVLFSGSFLFSLYCGVVMRYSAMDIGMIFLKGSAIQVLAIPLIGRFGGKLDLRLVIAFGMLAMSLSLWTNAHLTNLSDESALIHPLLIRALGLGAVFVPLNLVAVSDIPARSRDNALGLFNLTRELGGSFGTAWMSTQLDSNLKLYQTHLSEHVTLFDARVFEQLAQARRLVGGRSARPLEAALTLLRQRMDSFALVRSFEHGFTTLTLLFLASTSLVLLLRRPRSGSTATYGH